MNSRVTPQGQAMGKNATRLAALGLQRLQAAGLADVQAPMLRTEMCKTCACQPNTAPNGCLQTQMDFLKAATEGRPFLCPRPWLPLLVLAGGFARDGPGHHRSGAP